MAHLTEGPSETGLDQDEAGMVVEKTAVETVARGPQNVETTVGIIRNLLSTGYKEFVAQPTTALITALLEMVGLPSDAEKK